MVFLIESLAVCILFTLIVVVSCYRNPLGFIDDYPPKLAQRIRDLGLVKTPVPDFKAVMKVKLFKTPIIGLMLSLIVFFVNKADTFLSGMLYSYALWFIVAWWDAFVIDCLWVCHSKKIRVKGTEDMISEWQNYGFHIRMSGVGTLLGIPAAIFAGLFTMILNLIF